MDNIFLSKKLASKKSYQDLSDHTRINREYIRKLVTHPEQHENIPALIAIGTELGMVSLEVRLCWSLLRKEELERRTRKQADL